MSEVPLHAPLQKRFLRRHDERSSTLYTLNSGALSRGLQRYLAHKKRF